MCILSAFMSETWRLPGKQALKKIEALSTKLARKCNCFIDFTSIVDGSELSKSLQVVSVHDIYPVGAASSLKGGALAGGLDLCGMLSRSEAEDTILMKMPVGWVGVLVTLVAAETFVKKEKGFDCISLKHSGEWGARTECQDSRVLEQADHGAELFIFRKKSDLFI